MKKRMHKLCTILTASALLAMSVTVYAAEGDNTEAGFQPAEEGTVQSADTEQTEEKDPEENGLDSFIYIREKEDKTTEKAKVKKVTIEELKEVIERLSKKMNQAAAELNFELAAQLRDELKEFKIAYQEYDD